jgi:PAS domain-containing protein
MRKESMVELPTSPKSILEGEGEASPRLRSTLEDNARLRRDLARRLEELETIRATLVRAEAHTRAIIDAAQEGIVLFDTKGIVQEFNPQASAMFGWSPEEVVGRNLADFAVPPRLHHVLAQHLDSTFRAKGRRFMSACRSSPGTLPKAGRAGRLSRPAMTGV